MQTISYKGYWLHIGFNGHVKVQRPDYTMIEHSYTTLEQAKRDICLQRL